MQEHILIAEDDAGLRLALAFVLKNQGYRLSLVEDGKSALDRIAEAEEQGDPVDVLITDIQMPIMNGMELIRQLDEAGEEIPVIVITGHGDKDMLIELLRLGCDEFLPKPFEPDEVQDKLAKVLEKHAETRKVRENERNKLEAANIRLDREVEAYKRDLKDLRGEVARAVRTYSEIMDVDKTGFPLVMDYRARPFRDLGGDYLGLRNCGEDSYILIADVAGHDLAASYQTVLIKSRYDQICQEKITNEVFFQRLNEELIDNCREERMVTAMLLRVNLSQSKAEITSAGHPRIIIQRKGSTDVSTIMATGSVLGISKDAAFGCEQFEIQSGDRLFLYTDGLLNVYNMDGATGTRRVLGERGLCRALGMFFDQTVADQVHNTWRFARSFCRYRQSDDMLLVGIEIP